MVLWLEHLVVAGALGAACNGGAVVVLAMVGASVGSFGFGCCDLAINISQHY